MIVSHDVRTIDGQPISLDTYRGKVLLIVNVASECGLTPQYEGLQALYASYAEQGLEVLGFPCNDFGKQEPGTHEEIVSFCTTHYGANFPMFEKVNILSEPVSPLYDDLMNHAPQAFQGEVKWNFTKFLIDRGGEVIARFEPQTTPRDPEVIAAIEAALNA